MKISTNAKWRHALLAALLPALALLSQPSLADSRDALFGDLDDTPKPKAAKPANDASGLKGFVQFELARTIDDPTHWSKLRTRGEIGTQGKLGSGMKWKANLRLDYDAVFDVNDHYPSAVAHNQRATAALRETYLDISAGDWDFRLGRQHVVWGEMVVLFFADVVSARDLREFILPGDSSAGAALSMARAVIRLPSLQRFPQQVDGTTGRPDDPIGSPHAGHVAQHPVVATQQHAAGQGRLEDDDLVEGIHQDGALDRGRIRQPPAGPSPVSLPRS